MAEIHFQGIEDYSKPVLLEKNMLLTEKGDNDMKNILKRTDGRWQYRKMIDGARVYVYAKTQRELIKKIKKANTKEKPTITKINKTIDLINEWYLKYKSGLVSNKSYQYAIQKYFTKNKIFEKNINALTFDELETFLQNIDHHRTQAYCYYILKGTFEYSFKQQILNKNIIELLTKPKRNGKKGTNFNLKEQKLILENLDKSNMKNEILFYLLVGCRRTEAINVSLNDIDFENYSIFIDGTKTKSAKRYVPISKKFAEILKNNFNNMFKKDSSFYTHEFKRYLDLLNIKNHKLHDLRHTFSTNLYYLKVQDKDRQYYLGHSSITMTNDIYTHLDPNITKEQILNLYKDLYPEF